MKQGSPRPNKNIYSSRKEKEEGKKNYTKSDKFITFYGKKSVSFKSLGI